MAELEKLGKLSCSYAGCDKPAHRCAVCPRLTCEDHQDARGQCIVCQASPLPPLAASEPSA